jgi:hypothetical protein
MILAKAGASVFGTTVFGTPVAGLIEIWPNFHARHELSGQDLVIFDLSQR